MAPRSGLRSACALLVTASVLAPAVSWAQQAPADAPQAPAAAAPATATPPPEMPQIVRVATPPPSATPAPAPSPSAGPPVIPVHFESGDPAVSFHMRRWDMDPSAPYEGPWAYVCQVPCDVGLLPGEHKLGLSYPGSSTQEAAESVAITGPTTVHAYYISRHQTRFGGWMLFWGSLIAGSVISAVSYHSSNTGCSGSGACVGSPTLDTGVLATGIVVGVGGMLTSLYFILQPDEAHLEVGPAGGPAAPPAATAP